jgi:hypothetical protein
MAFPVLAAAGTVTNLLGSLLGSNEQAKQLKRAREALQKGYGSAREEISPWRQAGEQALNMLTEMTLAGPGDMTEDPAYKFQLSEGLKAAQRGAGASGQLGTGAFAKRLTEYGQGLASTYEDKFLDRYYKRLSSLGALSNTGYGAATNTANMYIGEGQGVADIQTGIGQARASGYTGAANSIYGGLKDWQTNQYLGEMNDAMTLSSGMARGIQPRPEVGLRASTYGM